MAKNITVKEAIEELFLEEFQKKSSLILIGENVLDNNRKPTLELLKKQFPDRVLNHIPLVEEMLGFIGFGMSIEGFTPIIQIDHSAFIPLIADSIYRIAVRRFRFCEFRSPTVVFRIGFGGGGGPDLSSPLIHMLFGIPNTRIFIPSKPYFAKTLYRQAFTAQGPTIVIEDKRIYDVYEERIERNFLTPFYPASSVVPGTDITVVSWGWLSQEVLAAREELKKYGINIEIVILQTLYPPDLETVVASISKTGRGLILDEEPERGSSGLYIYHQIKNRLPGYTIKFIAGKNVPIPSLPEYRNLFDLSKYNIVEECKSLMR